MLSRCLIVISIPLLIASASLPTNLLLPSNLAPSDTNFTVHMNQVRCHPDPDRRPLSDYTTCIPSLFRMYAIPAISSPIVWDQGDFRQWGPETDFGGCCIVVDGGVQKDIFSVETLLGPVIWALGKCFAEQGDVKRNRMAKMRVGPRKDWWLTVILDVVEPVGRNGSVE